MKKFRGFSFFKRLAWWHYVLVAILLVHAFFRFYELDARMLFNWDQVQNAWVMKDIFFDHRLPILGMVAKLNSGFRIGPAYYYLLAPFYLLTHFDPIGAAIFAGVVSVITAIVLFFIAKRTFSLPVALVCIAIYAVSNRAIVADRVPWPVIFLPLVSACIFYFLYKAISDSPKYILPLAIATGFAFHIHFTAIFFPIIILLASPLLIKQKQAWKYILIGIPLFLVWFIPHVIAETQNAKTGANLLSYTSVYFHGFHLRRMMQLLYDAFIELSTLLYFREFRILSPWLPLIFGLVYWLKEKNQAFSMLILIFLWFLVPWIIFTTYSGEISDYYFAVTRPMALFIIGYLLWQLFSYRNLFVRGILVAFFLYYAWVNTSQFLNTRYGNLELQRQEAHRAAESGVEIKFQEGVGPPYLYYIYTHTKQK